MLLAFSSSLLTWIEKLNKIILYDSGLWKEDQEEEYWIKHTSLLSLVKWWENIKIGKWSKEK
jgi:hypothetical protein